MLPKRLRNARKANQEIDITPFMNLMAVLTPFLLATAVFTRLAVLDIYLPPPSDTVLEEELPDPEKEALILTISITDRGLIVSNVDKIIAFISATDEVHNLVELSNILRKLKARYPEEQNVIVLSTPMISYGTVVEVMDATRIYLDKERGTRSELFPNISLGEVL